MPSRPFGAGVLVTLDIVARSVRLITVAGAARRGARGVQLPFIPEKDVAFQMTSRPLHAPPAAAYSSRFVKARRGTCSRCSSSYPEEPIETLFLHLSCPVLSSLHHRFG